MKKLILVALAPLAMLTVPAGAQTVERQTVVRPDGSVSRTVVRTERRDGDREVSRTVGRSGDRQWGDRSLHRGWERGRMVRRCRTTWRHNERARVCNVRHGGRY